MLRMLEAKGAESFELRSQIQRELDMAEEQIRVLQTRQNALQQGSSRPFLRPRAIRAVQGLEDLNRSELHFASDSDEEADVRMQKLLTGLVRVLAQLTGAAAPTAQNAPPAPPMRRPARAQIDVLAFLSSMLRAYPLLRPKLAHDAPSLTPMYVTHHEAAHADLWSS